MRNRNFVSVLVRKSYRSDAKQPRGAGLITRREFRQAKNLSDATLRAYRAGFNTMWKHAGRYMARKGIPRPGEFCKTNIHGGQLWGSRKECKLTEKMAGEIIERVYECKKVGLDQLKQVRHSLSYAFYLTTGKGGENYDEVNAQWRSFALKELPPVRRRVMPVRIPVPLNLKMAFKSPWYPGHALSLAKFVPAVLCSHDTHVTGLRPNVDVAKVKNSTIHVINTNELYGYTEMVGGRSKLHGPNRGTRPWRVYRVCFCEKEHFGPPDHTWLDKQGNPVDQRGNPVAVMWNTVCPLACMEFMRNQQGSDWKPYAKYAPSTGLFKQNVGNVPVFANSWLVSQGVTGGPFDRNCGRKCLSRWLQLLLIEYHEHMHIHGDLEEVWRDHYQTKLRKSGYRERKQAVDIDLATAALRKLANWLWTSDEPQPSVRQQLQSILNGMS